MSKIPRGLPIQPWQQSVSHSDLVKFGMDQSPNKIAKSSKKTLKKIPQNHFETEVPSIRTDDDSDYIAIHSKEGRKIKVDRGTGYILSHQKTKNTVFERIYMFNTDTLPKTDRKIYLSHVGYWMKTKHYIPPKNKPKKPL